MSPRRRTNEEENRHLKIFLLKEGFDTPSTIFKNLDGLSKVEIDDVGSLYYANSFHKPPAWLALFTSFSEEDRKKLFNSSTKAVLLVEAKNRKFALTFGYGRYLMKDSIVEPRFGLKATLNSVNKDSIRSIDKTSLGSVPLHSREQLSRSGSARDFGINFDEDLIRAITGTSKDEDFGKIVSGSDTLAVSIPCEIGNIKDFLGKCFDKSESKEYQIDFPWIDQVQEIRDKSKEKELNEAVIEKIKQNQTDKIWLAVPEIIDWADVAGFKYKDEEEAPTFDDISLDDFLKTLRDRNNLKLDHLKNYRIYWLRASDDSNPFEWPVFQCLYAEIDLNYEKYILTNKSWYKVDSNYVQKINNAHGAIPQSDVVFPDYEVAVYGGQGNDKGEPGYNKAFAEADTTNRCLMDRKNINYGGGHSLIEFCDIFTKDKKLIHVKRYGGSSSLSHLFQQGFVSGELFREDEQFRTAINNKLASGFKLSNPATAPNQNEYEIVFVVINHSARELDLPFFSKITLHTVERRLRGFGYKVSLKKVKSIPVPTESE